MSATAFQPRQSGIAVLAHAEDNDGFGGSAPWLVHGVLLSDGAITEGRSGERRFWPAETLQEAADRGVFEERSIVKNFHDLEGQAHADDVIGEVTTVGFADGIGFVFEGEVTDREIAEKIAHGYLDVSPVPLIGEETFDERLDAFRVERIEAGRDIAVVDIGAVEDNEIALGPNPAVAALSIEALSGTIEALQGDQADTDGGGSPDGGSQDGNEPAEPGADSGDPGSDDSSNGGAGSRTQENPNDTQATTMSDLSEELQELLARARAMDDPTVVEAAALRRFNDSVELIDDAEALDSPTVVDANEYEALQEDVEEIKELLGNVLVEERGLKETTVEAMSLEAMTSEVRDEDGNLDIDPLSQEPETGDPGDPGDGGSGGAGDGGGNGSGGDVDLSGVDRETRTEAAHKLRKAKMLQDRTPEHAEALEAEACDLLGVDDAEALELKVDKHDDGIDATVEVL